MSMDYTRCHTARESALIQNQYEKIYRYCYFKLHNRELAEDITQETFLRYLEKYRFTSPETALKYLYTIAGHLCIDEFRKPEVLSLEEPVRKNAAAVSGQTADLPLSETIGVPSKEDSLLTALALQKALRELTAKEQELLLLRYVNETPVSVMAGLFGISRFALRRKLLAAAAKLRKKLE